MGPRITPEVEPLDDATAACMEKLIPKDMAAPKLFLSIARHRGLFAFLVNSGLAGPTGLMDLRSLARELREAIILRTCVATRNDYEFNLHVQTIAHRMGLSDAQIQDVKCTPMSSQLWSRQQLAAAELVDSLVASLKVPDEIYRRARECFSEVELIEITQLIGLYTGVAMMVGLIQPEFDRYRAGPVVKVTADE